MMIGDLIYISGKYMRRDYLALQLQIDSSQNEWKTAIDIFEDRIGGRFFAPITVLLKCQRDGLDSHKWEDFKTAVRKSRNDPQRHYPNEADLIPNGFAVMALICLLMETLMQFREGLPVTPRGQNAERYTDFIERNLDFSHKDAERFYSDIRCGLLHSGETKNFSCLSIDQEDIITPKGMGAIKVDVNLLEDKLRSYYQEYCAALREGKDNLMRAKFIRKMDSITKKWENNQKLDSLWNAIRSQQGRNFRDADRNDFSITSSTNRLLRINNRAKVLKTDISEAVCFWNDKDAINIHNQWKYIVPLLEACREEADKFIVRAG